MKARIYVDTWVMFDVDIDVDTLADSDEIDAVLEEKKVLVKNALMGVGDEVEVHSVEIQ